MGRKSLLLASSLAVALSAAGSAFATEEPDYCNKEDCKASGWDWDRGKCKKDVPIRFKCDEGWKARGHLELVYADKYGKCELKKKEVIDVCLNLHPNFNQDDPDWKKMPTTVPCEQHCKADY